MSARDEILARLRRSQREAELPPRWTSGRNFPDLADRFTEALTAARGEVHRAADAADARQVLGRRLDELGAGRVMVDGDPALDAFDLPALRPALAWSRVGESPEDHRDLCARADVGVSTAAAALAETGTVVLESGSGRSRLAPLLPPVHVVLLPVSRLTADIFTWAAARGASLPTQMVLVSGPSKTADIEQTLAVGVHGPGRVIVILYDD